MLKHQSDYCKITVNQTAGVLSVKWFPATINMSDTAYQNELRIVINSIVKSNLQLVLADLQELYFPIDPSLQDWTIMELMKDKVVKNNYYVAYLGSKDLFSEVSVEQTMESYEETNVMYHFFTKYDEAMQWLIKKRENNT